MNKVAIIGAGVSGLTMANLLKGKAEVTVFEKDDSPGGLVKCQRVNGSLFHTCGGHVFNSKRQDVLDWFWSQFDRDYEFTKADRNSVVFLDGGGNIPYPIEDHMYLFDVDTQKRFIDDLIDISRHQGFDPQNFEEFLIGRFGKTLYELYFKPYNEKVWRRDLKHVPLSWLEGKLPMPTVDEMIFNNINHVKEKAFVHSTFWYEKENGSQLIVNRLSEGITIKCGLEVDCMEFDSRDWLVQGERFDKVVFCGNIKDMVSSIKGIEVDDYKPDVEALEYHGTTSVFCEIDKNPYSWIYLPDKKHESHRIICTGNFSTTNNSREMRPGRITATIEFTDEISIDSILDNLKRIPLTPHYITHKYNKYTYPIQNRHTRNLIASLKQRLAPYGFYFCGRFADWEYYNMDVAIAAAMKTEESIRL